MEFFPPLEEGRLIRRYKRFLADVVTAEGETLCIHCPNTGSMLNCLNEGGRVWFQRSQKKGRKLPATWELLETPHGRLACINTQRANTVVEEALKEGLITELQGCSELKREVVCSPGSRMDFHLKDAEGRSTWLEVKSVTLGFPDSAVAAFPDSVSTRAARHLQVLTERVQQGERACLLYLVNLSGIEGVRAAQEIDAHYAQALQRAIQAGVEVWAYRVDLSPQSLHLEKKIPVLS